MTVENPEAATAASTPRRITVTLEDAIAAMNEMPNTVCSSSAVSSTTVKRTDAAARRTDATVKRADAAVRRADAAAGRDVTLVPTVAHTHRSASTVVSLSF